MIEVETEWAIWKMRLTEREICFSGYLAGAADLIPKEVNVDNWQMVKDLEEIEEFRYNEEGRLEMEKKIGG